MKQSGDREGRYNIRVLDRAIQILAVLSDGELHSLTDLSERVKLSSSTTFRILSNLHYHHYVQRDEQSGTYKLGLACLELARAYSESNDLRLTALSELEALRDATKETVHLAVLDRNQVVYLDKLPGLHAIGIMSSQIGRRAPAYCTGLGKVLLAYQPDRQSIRDYFEQRGLYRFTDATVQSIDALMAELDEIEQRGYAFDRGEHELEVRCVAAPIFDINGRAIAAISISGPSSRLDPLEQNREIIEQVLKSAHLISAKLGYRPTARESKTESIVR